MRLEVATFTYWSHANLPSRYYVVRRDAEGKEPRGYVYIYANKSDVKTFRKPLEIREFLSAADAMTFALVDNGWGEVVSS